MANVGRARRFSGGTIVVSALAWAALTPGVAAAAEPSVYAGWTVQGANPSWTGTMTVPATGFPAATFTTDSNTPSVASGASTFLGDATPFGGVFGTSANQQYVTLAAAAGSAPSTTTFTFDHPTPASGWGFALGDVDADTVTVEATDADGNPVSVVSLGWQSAFNYCAVSPKPGSCAGPGPFTDVPTWDPATSTLIGNSANTNGAAGWFMPTTPITSLTLTFTVLTGIPSYQVWFAGNVAAVSGQVELLDSAGGQSAYEGAEVQLLDADGNPVLDASGNPVTTTTAADGSYAFPGVARDLYTVRVVPPPGTEVVGSDELPADATSGDATDVDFLLQVPAPPTTTPPPTSAPPTSAPPTSSAAPLPVAPPSTAPSAPVPQLAATGTSNASGLAVAGLGLLALGVAMVAAVRLRRR